MSRSGDGDLALDAVAAGDQVAFDLDGLRFTFEKFGVAVNEECLRLHVDDEAPINLIFLGRRG